MNPSPIIVLAIAPGKREFGIAVFVDAELIYSAVKTCQGRKSGKLPWRGVTDILQRQFYNFSPLVVVVKSISQYQKLSPDLERISQRIELESKRNGLPVVKVSLEQIKTVLGNDRKSTQKEVIETLLKSYPELQRFWNRPNKWQNDYYAFLFSAVAVGAVYLKTLSQGD